MRAALRVLGVRLSLARALVAVVLCWPLGQVQPGPPIVRAAASGRLLLPRGGNLSVLDLASGAEQSLYESQQVILGAAWSPDGSTLAILGGDGLWLVPLNGASNPRLLTRGSYGSFDWRA